MNLSRPFVLVIALCTMLAPHLGAQELRGHGGPVRALAVSADGRQAISGSFDQSAILWQLDTSSARAVLRVHEGAVNAVAALPGGRFATGGEDGRIALWPSGGLQTGSMPEQSVLAHQGGVTSLALSADGALLASAGWDGSAQVMALATGRLQRLEGHKGPLSAIAFMPDGSLVTTGHDATLRLWSGDGWQARSIQLPVPLNTLAIASNGEIIGGGADGRLHFMGADGITTGSLEIAPVPLVALALAPDGQTIAAGGLRGQTPLVDRASRRLLATLVGPGLPVWSLAFTPDGRQLLSGGADRLVRRWNARTGEPVGALVPRADVAPTGTSEERGAQVFRACAACHTLTPNDGNRAGPSLHGVFGRRIASASGYSYSPSLKAMDIVWTADTISRLFEIGPTAYTPGTKMPEQVITSPQDRKALVDWLERVTR
jgi:cytochrome c